jgi:N-methylhydantoinase A
MVPPDPGLLSAYGMLAAPVTRESSRTVLLATDDLERMGSVFGEMEAQVLDDMTRDGASREDTAVEHTVDARYRGQSFELQVPRDGWIAAFHAAHHDRYGYSHPESPVEAVTLRVVARTPGPSLERAPIEDRSGPPPTTGATVRFGGRDWTAHRVRRKDLRSGHELEGPVMVEEYSATTWVPPGWFMRVDARGILHLLPPE